MTGKELQQQMINQLAGNVTCREFADAVTEYMEGTLGLCRWLRFQMHLGLCLGCRRFLKQMRYSVQVLGALPPEPVPDAVRAELIERFRNWKREISDDPGKHP